MTIAENVRGVLDEIRSLTTRPVTLVGVTKGRSFEEAQELMRAGVKNLGENRLREFEQKFCSTNVAEPGAVYHFIGHLQSRKVADTVRYFDWIQSVDSLKLAQKISHEAGKIQKTVNVLIEVNTSGEPQKGGVALKEAAALVKAARSLPNLNVRGLMTMAVHSENEALVRACFRALRRLFDEIGGLDTLSMGMSGDYKIALEEGAGMVRIGRKIFNP